MRFLRSTLGDDSNGGPQLSPDRIAGMTAVVEEAKKAGILVMNVGLAPSATTTVVTNDDGALDVRDGPFAEAKEIIGGFAVIEVASKDEAIAFTKRLLSAAGNHELRVRAIYG